MKKMNDPLLLTYPASGEGRGSGNARDDRFKKARGPGGLGYDNIAKCEGREWKITHSFFRVDPL